MRCLVVLTLAVQAVAFQVRRSSWAGALTKGGAKIPFPGSLQLPRRAVPSHLPRMVLSEPGTTSTGGSVPTQRGTWSPSSWRNFETKQLPDYPDMEALQQAEEVSLKFSIPLLCSTALVRHPHAMHAGWRRGPHRPRVPSAIRGSLHGFSPDSPA